MNTTTQTADCLLYSAGVYGFDEAPPALGCRGRELLHYGGPGGTAAYPSVEGAADLYEEMTGCPPAATDYRHVVASSPFFGRISAAAERAFPGPAGSYSTPAAHGCGDCYGGFPTSFGGGGRDLVADCAVAEDDRRHQRQTSTLNDGLGRACRTLQATTTPQQQQQQQLLRPTTYKWMTVKRGPPKTTGKSSATEAEDILTCTHPSSSILLNPLRSHYVT